MAKALFLIFMFYYTQAIFSQTEILIEEKITSFFEALNQKKHEDLRKSFAFNAQLQSILLKDNEASMLLESVIDFTEAIKNIPDNVTIEEKINSLYIKVDGVLAFASMNYEFFVNEDFSHKGTNYFQFVFLDNDWLIVHILDSRVFD